ncbi:MAG: hypothetical protein JWM44_1130 [Bacilli bacterium]|nr:hypothetical protein [Bacilli bacterium]
MSKNQSTAPSERTAIDSNSLNVIEDKLLTEVQGKSGIIRILKSVREMTEADEDIYTLIARILIKKEKRLALDREHST